MDKKISHAEATALEYIVRSVFNCERFGVMGVADADHGAQFQTGCADILVQRRTGTCGANSVYLRSLSGQ